MKNKEYHYTEGHVFLLTNAFLSANCDGMNSSEIETKFLSGLSGYRDENGEGNLFFVEMPISKYLKVCQGSILSNVPSGLESFFPIFVPLNKLKFTTDKLALEVVGECVTYDQALADQTLDRADWIPFLSYDFIGTRNLSMGTLEDEWGTFDEFLDVATRELLAYRSFKLDKEQTELTVHQVNGIGERRYKTVVLYHYLGKDNREYYF